MFVARSASDWAMAGVLVKMANANGNAIDSILDSTRRMTRPRRRRDQP